MDRRGIINDINFAYKVYNEFTEIHGILILGYIDYKKDIENAIKTNTKLTCYINIIKDFLDKNRHHRNTIPFSQDILKYLDIFTRTYQDSIEQTTFLKTMISIPQIIHKTI